MCSNFIFCMEIKVVSEPEKKADKRRQMKNSTKYNITVPVASTVYSLITKEPP